MSTASSPRRILVPLVAAVLAASCHQSAVPPAAPLHTVIGAQGGTLTVGQGELLLTVPPGALAQDVMITLESGSITATAAMLVVSPAFHLGPATTTFAVPAQLTLPFDSTLVNPVVSSSEILVACRAASGEVQTLLPSFVDTQSLNVDTSALGTFWVVAPDVIAASSAFPLRNNDSYHYDDGMVLTVVRSSTEPNLSGISVAKATFTVGEATTGIYFDYRNTQLGMLGSFRGTATQLVFAESVLCLDRRDAVGVQRPVFLSYSGYEPVGSTTAAYQGLASTLTSVTEHERWSTALGWFHTVHVVIATELHDTRPASEQSVLELWLAAGVGPVAVRLPGSSRISLLQTATVNGRPVSGS